MRETTIIKVEKLKEVPTMIECDFCHKKVSLEGFDSEVENCEAEAYSKMTNFNVKPGYGSRFDLMEFDFDICDDCLEKWLTSKKQI